MHPAPTLCAHLQPLLDAELAAGNVVHSTDPAPGSLTGRLVLLRHPFRRAPDPCPALLRFRSVNDPHWWLAEYGCPVHADLLACAFD